MGLACSQTSFLALTARKSDISFMLSGLSNQKMRLASESAELATEYRQALNSKVLKYSNNGGATYSDITYNALMNPSVMNQYDPYILTDRNDKVVVDNKYKPYAALISPNGQGGKDWFNNANRNAILSQVTGIKKTDLDKYDRYDLLCRQNEANLKAIIANEPPQPMERGIEDLLEYACDSPAYSYDNTGNTWAKYYEDGYLGLVGELGAEQFHEYANGTNQPTTGLKQNYEQLAREFLASISNEIPNGYDKTTEQLFSDLIINLANTLSAYFPTEVNVNIEGRTYTNAWKAACQEFLTNFNVMDATIWEFSPNERNSVRAAATKNFIIGFNVNEATIEINTKNLIDTIIGYYQAITHEYSSVDNMAWYYPPGSPEYENWKEEHDPWQQQYDAAKSAYDNSYETLNSIFTSEQLREIDFYDSLFSTIAEKGWNYNENVSDKEYLNQVLQNNIYSLTRVQINKDYDNTENKFSWSNNYHTDVASNVTNIISMNDTDKSSVLLAKYESKKAQLQSKETRIDNRMNNLETELNSITSRLSSLENIMSKDIDRYFKIFTS